MPYPNSDGPKRGTYRLCLVGVKAGGKGRKLSNEEKYAKFVQKWLESW